MSDTTPAPEPVILPDGNNVFGTIAAPKGLQPVLRAIEGLIGEDQASIYRSSYDGSELLRVRSARVEFDSDPLDDGVRHSFNGGVAGSLEEVERFVRALAEVLGEAGIEHRFEIHDEDQKLARVIPQ